MLKVEPFTAQQGGLIIVIPFFTMALFIIKPTLKIKVYKLITKLRILEKFPCGAATFSFDIK